MRWCERPLNATRYPAQVSKGVGCSQGHPIPLNTCHCASPLLDSESERSLSGFETLASRSVDEEEDNNEEEEEGSELFRSTRSRPVTRMSQEDRRGDEEDEDTRPNGVKKHR